MKSGEIMNETFNIKKYESRISELTERAKIGNKKTDDTDIGEEAYLAVLNVYVDQYHQGKISKDNLIRQQKTLRLKLEQHYQHKEIDELHILIRNRYSHILTEAEKSGCPICKKLVRFFDGRDTNG